MGEKGREGGEGGKKGKGREEGGRGREERKGKGKGKGHKNLFAKTPLRFDIGVLPQHVCLCDVLSSDVGAPYE